MKSFQIMHKFIDLIVYGTQTFSLYTRLAKNLHYLVMQHIITNIFLPIQSYHPHWTIKPIKQSIKSCNKINNWLQQSNLDIIHNCKLKHLQCLIICAWAGYASGVGLVTTIAQYCFKMANSALHGCVILTVVIYAAVTEAFQPVDVKVTFDTDNSPDFKVFLSGVEWLRSGAVSITDNGQTWASNNKDKYILKSVQRSTATGSDVIGEFDTTT